MTLKLYAHPFSSYCQKVLTALYENDTPFEYRMLDNKEANAELTALWPVKRSRFWWTVSAPWSKRASSSSISDFIIRAL